MNESASWNPLAALADPQRALLEQFQAQLLRLNQRLNLISPDTEAHFEERHLLHSLALTDQIFPPGAVVVDWGTGGGLPAIPLAICFPEVTFHAVDAVGKKIQAVQTMARRLGLANLHPWQGRADRWPGKAHYSVSRATAPLAELWHWHQRIFEAPTFELPDNAWPPGLLCLKGGDLEEEIAALRQNDPNVMVEQISLYPLIKKSYFQKKYLLKVYVQGSL